MTTQNTLTIDRPTVAGETIEHDGSIIVKTPVADGVSIKAKNGGIILEQGCGNNVKLRAMHSGTRLASGGLVVSGDLVGRNVVINGRVICSSSGMFNSQSDISGITVKGDVGDAAKINTNGSVTLTSSAGRNLELDAGGSLKAKAIGGQGNVKTGGSIQLATAGPGTSLNAGGSVEVTTAQNGCLLSAGGSIRAQTIMDTCDLDAGGSIQITKAGKGLKAQAGGSITIDSLAPDAKTSAGGSVRIAGQKQKRGW